MDTTSLQYAAFYSVVVFFTAQRLTTPSSAYVTGNQPTSCQEHSDVMALYRRLRNITLEHSNQHFQSHMERLSLNTNPNMTIMPLHDNRCVGRTSQRPCNCSQKYEINFDPTRIPKILMQTRCCNHTNHYGQNRPVWRLSCREVTHKFRVLKRSHCLNGRYEYESTWDEIAVGCSCFWRQ